MTSPAHRRARHLRPPSGVGRGLAVLLVGAVAVGAAVLGSADPATQGPRAAADVAETVQAAPSPPVVSADSADRRWFRVLDRLDALRARAWRRGDPGLLRAVYTRDSAALRADRAMLRSYLSRGLRPDGVRLDVGSVRVVGRRPGEVALAVVDRLRPVRIRTADGGVASLPADEPTAHTLVLRRVDGRWLIAVVH